MRCALLTCEVPVELVTPNRTSWSTRCVGSSASSDYSRFLLLAMAPAPGDLLRLSDLEINNKVQAMFEDG